MGDNGADKGEINQRSDKPGKASSDLAIGMDFDVSALVCIPGKPEALRLGKRAAMFGIDVDSYAVELFDDAAEAKRCQVSQSAYSLMVQETVVA